MLHMSYGNLLFSSIHMYTELRSLMWWGFNAQCPRGLDALMRAGMTAYGQEPVYGGLFITYLLSPSDSWFSM